MALPANRPYKSSVIHDHGAAYRQPYGLVYRRYSVNFIGANYDHTGPDMATLWTEWFHTLAAAKRAITQHWQKRGRT